MALGLIAVAAYYIYDVFHEKTSHEKIAHIIHIEDSRNLSDELLMYLEDPDPIVRARAARSIGRIGKTGSAKHLFKLVTSDVIDVAAASAFAIGQIGDKEYAGKLLDIAYDAPARVGEMSLDAVGRLTDSTDTDNINQITTFLNHPAPEVRKAALMALFRANAKSQSDVIINFINEESLDDVKVTALYVLSRMGVKEAFSVYENFLTDGDPYARSLAVRGIGRSDNKDAVRYLLMALNDADNKVASQAIFSLTIKEDDKISTRMVQKLKQTNDEKVTLDLINALATRESVDGLETVYKMLENDPSDNIAAAALRYIAAVEKERAVSLIDSMSTAEQSVLRTASADAYASIGDNSVVSRLAVLFSDPDAMVRATAFSHLVNIDSGSIDFYLEKALSDSNYIPPVLALDQIKTRKLENYLPVLKEMSDSIHTINPEIRRAMVDCLSGFLTDNPNDSVSKKMFMKLMRDKDYIIRKEAVEHFARIYESERTDMLSSADTRISQRSLASAVKEYETTNPVARILTKHGEIEFELYFDTAPLTVLNFIELAEDDFYEGVKFHRVISNFVAQGGDPEGTGWGGAPYTIRCEYSPEPYVRGTVGIATSGKDTGSSQFFFALSPQPHLDGRYTVFGQVVSGMEVVDKLVIGDVIEEISITKGN